MGMDKMWCRLPLPPLSSKTWTGLLSSSTHPQNIPSCPSTPLSVFPLPGIVLYPPTILAGAACSNYASGGMLAQDLPAALTTTCSQHALCWRHKLAHHQKRVETIHKSAGSRISSAIPQFHLGHYNQPRLAKAIQVFREEFVSTVLGDAKDWIWDLLDTKQVRSHSSSQGWPKAFCSQMLCSHAPHVLLPLYIPLVLLQAFKVLYPTFLFQKSYPNSYQLWLNFLKIQYNQYKVYETQYMLTTIR